MMVPLYFTVFSIPYFLFVERAPLLAVQTMLYSVFLYYLDKLYPALPYVLVFVPWGLFALGKTMEQISAEMCGEHFPSLVPPNRSQISKAETPDTSSMAPPPAVAPVAGPGDE
mgnify:CR=1 FL=1